MPNILIPDAITRLKLARSKGVFPFKEMKWGDGKYRSKIKKNILVENVWNGRMEMEVSQSVSKREERPLTRGNDDFLDFGN